MKKIGIKSWLWLVGGIGLLVMGFVFLSTYNTEYEKLRQEMEKFVNDNNLGEYTWLGFEFVDSEGNEAFAAVFRSDVEKGAKDTAVNYVLDKMHGYNWCALHNVGGTILKILGTIVCCAFVVWFKYAIEPDSVKEERRKERERRNQEALIKAQINEEHRRLVLDIEYQQALESQNADEPWAIRYMTSPCKYCGHYKVRYAKWEDKRMSVAFWGPASSAIGKNYKCEHCGRMW